MYRRHYGVSPTKNARHYREFLIGGNSFIEHILLTSEGEQLPEEISKKLYIATFFALSETSREGFIAAGNERNNLLYPSWQITMQQQFIVKF